MTPPACRPGRQAPIDLLLWVMTLIWGANYSVVKVALAEMSPLAFNGIRLLLTSTLMLGAIRWRGLARPGRADLVRLLGLGAVGHFVYQLLFLGGLARTSVANSSLIIGCTPIVVLLLTSAVGHEPVTRWHWAGIASSVAGMALVVGRGASLTAASFAGDLMTIGAIVCWAVYTVGSRVLLRTHSPLAVTGWSMAFGTALYVPVASSAIADLDWTGVGRFTWLALLFSAVFALGIAYLIWYTAVQRIGNARTSVYSNLVPLVAMAIAVVWLGESLDVTRIAGAVAILTGLALTRRGVGAMVGPTAE